MIVDCRRIAQDLRAELAAAVTASRAEMRLAIVKASFGDDVKDAQTEAFLTAKRACGKAVGIDVREYDVSDSLQSQGVLEKRVSELACAKENDAVIIQLPLPPIQKLDGTVVLINSQAVLNRVPPQKDADVLHAESFGRYEGGSKTALIPPVVSAMEEVLQREAPDVLENIADKIVVAVGMGTVVGSQVMRWAKRNGVMLFSGLREGSDVARYTSVADIIVSGVGKSGIITADMVKEGAVIFDFGFSKEDGVSRGDVDPAVGEKVRLLTPVPGGMGPLSVTMLFWNVARIAGVNIK